jgi:type IV secretory pathway VirB2 component (pilin)
MKINGLLFLIVVLGMFMLPIAFAADSAAVCIKKTESYNADSCVKVACVESNANYNPQDCIVAKVEQIANLVTLIAGVIAVIAMVITGIMMAMSDDPESRNKLKDKLKYIIFGLVLIFAARFIVAIIIG